MNKENIRRAIPVLCFMGGMQMIVDDKIMKYIVFKKRTEEELKNKCKMLKYDDETIEQIVEYLKENGYINDEVYVEKYRKNVMRLKACSIREIKIDLMKRGINEDLIDKYAILSKPISTKAASIPGLMFFTIPLYIFDFVFLCILSSINNSTSLLSCITAVCVDEIKDCTIISFILLSL